MQADSISTSDDPRIPSSGGYDIHEVYNELQERLEWLVSHDKLDWLVTEWTRLKEENARLLEENRQLREELTLARLTREFELENERADKGKLPVIPAEAKRLFACLPASCTFAEFFEIASGEGIGNTDGKEYLRIFLQHDMLRHKGSRIEKTGWIPYPVPPIPLTHRR
jgi:regulator of replication initiation timing